MVAVAMTLISETVLSSPASSVSFTSISGTYKDLELEIICTTTAGGQNINIQFNGDTASNYSRTNLWGNGSSAYSNRNASQAQISAMIASGTSSSEPSFCKFYVMSYSSASVFKTVLNRAGIASGEADVTVGTWRSTSAITSVATIAGTSTFAAGSSFRLWGVS